MLVLLDTSENLDVCADEMGCEVEQLLTPLTRFRLQRPEARFAIDNGAYAKFDAKAFGALLQREESRAERCLFVAAPDVVGEAQRTLELFNLWLPQLAGWKVALVCQDGQERLPIPWDDLDAVFIGGSTTWKLSAHAAAIITVAKVHFGKWVHVGRVNDPSRFSHFENLGVDSVDGTGISRFTWMRERIKGRADQQHLFATT